MLYLNSGRKFLVMMLLALAFVCASQRAGQAATTTIYTDNLSKTTGGAESASSTRRLTGSFITGTDAAYLQSVTLLLANTTSGQATLSIYTNSLLQPGSLVGTLTAPASFTSSASETTFTATGIPLTANTTYWIVLQVGIGTFNWSWTKDNTGSGNGYTHTWGESDDSGTSWQTYNVYPLQMRVIASSEDATANPIDDASTFVTQHYNDFLNRAPDSGGLTYWTEQINGNSSNNPAPCATGDSACLLSRRIGVSAAFFIENEFQQTGSYVYRMYTTSLGRQPAYAEFTAERNQIDASNLAQSKQAFADAWVQRTAFVNKYGSNPTADLFVDALLSTLATYDGVDLSAKRSTYVGELQGGATRGQIVREVAEDAAVQSAEYNPSFVLMQYFGYLKRDADASGYQFWLNVLNNKEPNNYRGMVCSFLTSAEYQQRFGTSVTHFNTECSAAQ